ncbi:hypothetical protein [Sediminibacterium sp.]|uniref:hypothetical protein n=1 Tax=Sediminibacterium sp. TaxID=1917865 RepID=UPI0025FF94D8|nr:hypothetical protein [Sediminibacterium sp.]MBW0177576.1 hypothetical protein [Sediminibacterium sp.]
MKNSIGMKYYVISILCVICLIYHTNVVGKPHGTVPEKKIAAQASISEGNLYAMANIQYSGWYKIARSTEELGFGGRRGGVKISVTAAGNYLIPSQQVIYGFKNWTNSVHLSSVSDALNCYFTRYRIVIDNNTAYLEGYLPNLYVGGDSYFHIAVESIGIYATNWVAYDGAMTPGLTSPLAVSQLDITPNAHNYASLAVSGSIGIGTTNPQKKLDVWSGANEFAASVGSMLGVGQWSGIHFGYKENGNDNYKQAGLVFERTSYNAHAPGKIHLLNTTSYQSATLADAKVTIDETGNMGIGTVSPTEKLAVNGNVRAKKIIVSQSNWPDYVFDSSYLLKPLRELESFINKNKHLPDMPSAKEVEKKGISLGDNQALLLKKIEELTLHLIRQEKLLEKQSKQISELQKKLYKKEIHEK